MHPGRTGVLGLVVTVISALMTVAPVVVIATPVLRVLSVAPVIARTLTVPIDSSPTSPVLTATGVIAARATIGGAGKKAVAESQGMVSGLLALPALTGMTSPVFQPAATGTTLLVIGPAVARVGMSAPVMINPLALPVSGVAMVPVMTIGSVIQKRMVHPAFRVVRAGVTGPISQRLNG